MKESTTQPISASLGLIEPHAPLLNVPHDGHLLYKVMTVENLLRSVGGNYLHFNCVDSYVDLSGSNPHTDSNDGRQLPKDRYGMRCLQIFSVNYGIIEYVEWGVHKANAKRLLNPIIYTYLKDKTKFSEEKEFRISLSAMGMGEFALKDGSTLLFPSSLHVPFVFKTAIRDGTIKPMLCAPDTDVYFLYAKLNKFHIAVDIK